MFTTFLLVGTPFVLAGLFFIIGAKKEWNILMLHPHTEKWIELYGRDKTRLIYTVLGILLVVAAAALPFAIGPVDLNESSKKSGQSTNPQCMDQHAA